MCRNPDSPSPQPLARKPRLRRYTPRNSEAPSNHGPGRMGYVYLTTECMRWIQRFPLKNDDYFSYGDFDCPSNVIQTINGKQFQIRGLMVGRRFNKLLRVVEQAIIWSNQNER